LKAIRGFNGKFYLGLAIFGLGVALASALPMKTTSSTIPQQTVFLESKGGEYDRYLLQQQAEKLKGKWGGQCTFFVRQFLKATQNNIPSLARLTPTNSTEPELYAIVKTKESRFGHLGIVIDFDEESVTIFESNVPLGSEKIGIRKLKINDARILGYHILEHN